jgi:hypothetical protein
MTEAEHTQARTRIEKLADEQLRLMVKLELAAMPTPYPAVRIERGRRRQALHARLAEINSELMDLCKKIRFGLTGPIGSGAIAIEHHQQLSIVDR